MIKYKLHLGKSNYGKRLIFLMIILLPFSFSASERNVSITVDATKEIGILEPFWASQIIHPTEFLSTEWGANLLHMLAEAGAARQYVRIYNQPERAFWMDDNGNYLYDWSHFDEMADLIVATGNKLKVVFYGMPFELAVYPEHLRVRPYGGVVCSSPPKDYKFWEELCTDFMNHIIERYGLEEVKQWQYRCWNEPDNRSFLYERDLNEYLKLYDHFAKAIKDVNEDFEIGGPALTHGSLLGRPEDLRFFMDHVTSGINYATGEVGSPIDYISIHSYGGRAGGAAPGRNSPALEYMMEAQLQAADIRDEYPELLDLPIHVDEWGESSGGRVNMDREPMADIRNSQYGAALLIAFVQRHIQIRQENDRNFRNLVFCASGYEVIPERDFMGYRTLHTKHGFHKPILNSYKVLNKLGPELIDIKMSPSDNIIAIATRDAGKITIVVTNYQNDQVYNDGPSYPVNLNVQSNWKPGTNITMKHWRIDENHSNSYTVFKELGSPELPNPLEIDMIKNRMDLELLESPKQMKKKDLNNITFDLPSNAVSLIEIIRE